VGNSGVIKITSADFNRLNATAWLNDSLIDFYLKWIHTETVISISFHWSFTGLVF